MDNGKQLAFVSHLVSPAFSYQTLADDFSLTSDFHSSRCQSRVKFELAYSFLNLSRSRRAVGLGCNTTSLHQEVSESTQLDYSGRFDSRWMGFERRQGMFIL